MLTRMEVRIRLKRRSLDVGVLVKPDVSIVAPFFLGGGGLLCFLLLLLSVLFCVAVGACFVGGGLESEFPFVVASPITRAQVLSTK